MAFGAEAGSGADSDYRELPRTSESELSEDQKRAIVQEQLGAASEVLNKLIDGTISEAEAERQINLVDLIKAIAKKP